MRTLIESIADLLIRRPASENTGRRKGIRSAALLINRDAKINVADTPEAGPDRTAKHRAAAS